MITLIFILGSFTLFMVGLYEFSLVLWPDQKKCDWEIREEEERA